MKIEVINTGSELMLGRVLNTHQQWICRRLADQGYVVTRQIAVGDTGRDIQQAVRESLARARLVIVTGGLGPTSDDLTRDAIAELLGKKLREDAAVLATVVLTACVAIDRVSTSSTGRGANADTTALASSASGRDVAFQTAATNLQSLQQQLGATATEALMSKEQVAEAVFG